MRQSRRISDLTLHDSRGTETSDRLEEAKYRTAGDAHAELRNVTALIGQVRRRGAKHQLAGRQCKQALDTDGDADGRQYPSSGLSGHNQCPPRAVFLIVLRVIEGVCG